jgi:hypothetical protein
VEITSKLDGPLTVKTIRNTLHAKRNQVPSDRPAVLYVQIPSDWMRSEPTAMPVFNEALLELMKRSKRFNAVILVWEEVIPLVGGGIHTMSTRACFNDQPRHPFADPHLFEIPLSEGRYGPALSFLEKLKAKRRNRAHKSPL